MKLENLLPNIYIYLFFNLKVVNYNAFYVKYRHLKFATIFFFTSSCISTESCLSILKHTFQLKRHSYYTT